MSEPTSKHKEESAVQQALDSPAAAKGLDDSYQPVPDVRDDPAYFARLYDQYATDVLRVCYFYLSDREKAEDVCQDVFVRLMTTHPLLQPGREKSWLLKVALNRCRDLWRGAWLKRVILGGRVFPPRRPAGDDGRHQPASRNLQGSYPPALLSGHEHCRDCPNVGAAGRHDFIPPEPRAQKT